MAYDDEMSFVKLPRLPGLPAAARPARRSRGWALATCALLLAPLVACSSSSSDGGSPTSSGDGGGTTSAEGGAAGEAGASDGGTEAGPGDAGSESVVINFDDLPGSAKVADQYVSHARFSSDSGHFVTVREGTVLGSSSPNYACASENDGFCNYPYPAYVDFPKPVRQLTFRAVAVGSTSKFGEVKVVHAGGTTTVDMVGSTTESWVDIDLTQFDGVTRIEITNDDSAGIGMDDFKFVAPK